ncbi:MAG: nucleoside triphosphate pyrophosphohydrolase [Gammaproteobacteria bacterium]
MADLTHLLGLMRRLRDPESGCPWDLAQSFDTIVPHTLEEAYEVADAIESGDFDALPDELGDLLFQVVFYARLGEEAGRFGFADVVRAIEHKLTSRHPHVFGDAERGDAAAVVTAWEQGKAAERRERALTSELDGVALALPALSRAQKVQKRAARVGFDWPDAGGALAKVAEELDELEGARAETDRAAIAEEMGDLLFAAVNVARHLELDAETCLRAATAKFERRFRAVEADFAARGAALADADLAALEAAWQVAKTAQKKTGA